MKKNQSAVKAENANELAQDVVSDVQDVVLPVPEPSKGVSLSGNTSYVKQPVSQAKKRKKVREDLQGVDRVEYVGSLRLRRTVIQNRPAVFSVYLPEDDYLSFSAKALQRRETTDELCRDLIYEFLHSQK